MGRTQLRVVPDVASGGRSRPAAGVPVAVGAVAAVAALAALRRRRAHRRVAAVPTGEPGLVRRPDGTTVVVTDDGLPLHVEVDEGPAGAPLTLLLVHGFTARLGEFAPQRDALRSRARLVLYDQRGHGRSPRGRATGATFDQLGRDLAAVLDATTPRGPIVLLGHSMGGMTILSLLRQRPELLGSRVAGVFLLATSAGELTTQGPVGLWVRAMTRLRLLGPYLRWLRFIAPLVELTRVRGSAAGRAYIRRYLFGRDDADPALVARVQAMLEETPFTTTAAFYAAFLAHDEHATLPLLRRMPVTVLVGTHDRLTPAAHSRRMVDVIGESAELVVVEGAGHSVNITRPAVVNAAIADLLDRAARAAAERAGGAVASRPAS